MTKVHSYFLTYFGKIFLSVFLALMSCVGTYGFDGKINKAGTNGGQTFVIHAPVTSLQEFRDIAKQAARLKPFGNVEVNISALADKGFHEIPEGRSYWYEYASYNPTPFKFFPDSKIAPHIPSDFVKRNRDLLLGKAEILREFGLGAAFWSYEPNFLPESFYEAHPEMRGPRIDHPRRSNHPAFAPCIHLEETREMYKKMVAELVDHVPELNTFFFKTNDAGSGVCWADWLYTGANGPVHCQHYSTGETVAKVMNTFREGAKRSGEDITIYMTGSLFTDEEMDDIYNNLGERIYAQGQPSFNVQTLGTEFNGIYPVKGIFNPLPALERMIRLAQSDERSLVFINFRASYDRDYESPEIIEKFMSMLEAALSSSLVNELEVEVEEKSGELCSKWGGENSGDQLCEAFTKLQQANSDRDFGGRLSSRYWGTSVRHITRPLVFAPQHLSREDEKYFLPHIFNVSEEEARHDFTDIHGSARTASREAVMEYISRAEEAIKLIEEVSENAPEQEFLEKMVKAQRIYNSILRSSGNFAEAQVIRNRNQDAIEEGIRRPDKEVTWTGDKDMQQFNYVMRDELDNTTALIKLLESGGMELISHARDKTYEDTFVLGPDLVDQLKKKRQIIIKHWSDVEKYLTSPLK
jgi:hypothetical protein